MLSRRKPISEEAALQRMAALCSRSEQCTADIAAKLRRLGLTSGQTRDILERLTDMRFLDDARFARCFVSYKVRFAGWGKRKIRLALMQKSVGEADIAAALDAVSSEDYDAAIRRVAAQRARGLDLSAYDDRIRLFRSLAQRGFESELISREISELTARAEGL